MAGMGSYRVELRFYGELNDFLPLGKRGGRLTVTLKERDAIKDVIEAQGVPHTEVELILVHGEPVEFSYQVQDGDRVSVYPAFRTLDISSVRGVRPPWEGAPRFVLDIHLGTLAGWLRLLGFDTLYRNDYQDETLAAIAADEGRILLTRDRGLLKRRRVVYGAYVWETDPERQVLEVARRYPLAPWLAPFQRCLRCNGRLEVVSKAEVFDRLPPKTRLYYDEFGRCRSCAQVYWKGAHFQRLQALIERLVPRAGAC
ncbi:MAG TPA: Mut7-C RNAse domain-containing protein [Chloroflexota bacterium]|nr:Mut7-C RNAse domain-containing protein [Chloroflexota bacterium]